MLFVHIDLKRRIPDPHSHIFRQVDSDFQNSAVYLTAQIKASFIAFDPYTIALPALYELVRSGHLHHFISRPQRGQGSQFFLLHSLALLAFQSMPYQMPGRIFSPSTRVIAISSMRVPRAFSLASARMSPSRPRAIGSQPRTTV